MGTTDAASALLNAASATQKSKAPSRAVAPSIFSSDVVVVGDLKSKGDIQFDGQIEGSIQSVSLTVGETAMVKGAGYCRESYRQRTSFGKRMRQAS